MKITIGIPTNRGVKAKTVQSLLDMIVKNASDRYDYYSFHIVTATEGYTIAENRNYLAIQAQKNGSDYLFMVDDDMVFPPETLETLVKHDKDIIGVASNSRMLPLSHTVGLMNENGEYVSRESIKPWNKLPKELFKCYSVGTGVILIKMSVFERIEKPYFAFDVLDSGKVATGEDGWFCKQAHKATIDIWCDPTIQIGHIGEYIF